MAKFGKCNPMIIQGDAMQVLRQAIEYRDANDGRLLIGNVGNQADRAVFSSTITVQDFLHCTRLNELKNCGGDSFVRISDIRDVSQRAITPAHTKEIADYIRERILTGGPIIMPGVILNNVNGEGQLFVRDGDASVRFACMVIEEDAPLTVSDGMHRREAFQQVLTPPKGAPILTQEAEKMVKRMALPLMVTFEEDNDQVREDFADVATTRPIERGVIVAFKQNLMNDLTLEVIAKTPFLANHTSMAATQTASKSVHAWTANTLSRVLRVFVSGGRGGKDDAMSGTIEKNKAGDGAHFEANSLDWGDFTLEFWKTVQDKFPIYTELGAMLNAPKGYMHGLRERNGGVDNFILLNVVALEIIASIGNKLWRSGYRSQASIDHVTTLLATTIDWKKPSSSTDLWVGNIIPALGHSVSQKDALVHIAADKVAAIVKASFPQLP
jgi:DGQHR domain-containing protein